MNFKGRQNDVFLEMESLISRHEIINRLCNKNGSRQVSLSNMHKNLCMMPFILCIEPSCFHNKYFL
jgi:hypothetical protein